MSRNVELKRRVASSRVESSEASKQTIVETADLRTACSDSDDILLPCNVIRSGQVPILTYISIAPLKASATSSSTSKTSEYLTLIRSFTK